MVIMVMDEDDFELGKPIIKTQQKGILVLRAIPENPISLILRKIYHLSSKTLFTQSAPSAVAENRCMEGPVNLVHVVAICNPALYFCCFY